MFKYHNNTTIKKKKTTIEINTSCDFCVIGHSSQIQTTSIRSLHNFLLLHFKSIFKEGVWGYMICVVRLSLIKMNQLSQTWLYQVYLLRDKTLWVSL